jgi:citrate synthase
MPSGLDGVVAAETGLSHTDRERGMIWVGGVALPDLVARHGYEGTIALLWEGFAGDGLTRTSVRTELGTARVAAFAGLDAWLFLWLAGRCSMVSGSASQCCPTLCRPWRSLPR